MHALIIIYFITQIPSCPQDYGQWQQTMYCQFGQKWAKLHHGPIWRVAPSSDVPDSNARETMQVLQVPHPLSLLVCCTVGHSE